MQTGARLPALPRSTPLLSSPRPFAELQPHFRLPPHCSLPVGFFLLLLLLEAETVILPQPSPCILPYSPVELRIPHLKWLFLRQTQSLPVKGTCPGLSTGTFLSTSPRASSTDSPISSLIMQVPYCLDSILLLWKNTLRIAGKEGRLCADSVPGCSPPKPGSLAAGA